MTLPTPIIKIVDNRPLFYAMLSDIEERTHAAVDTETVGKSTLALFESLPELRKAWFTEARAFCKKFPKALGGLSIKGAKKARKEVASIQTAIERVYKQIDVDKSGLHFWENYLGCFQIGFEDGLVYMIRPEILLPEDWAELGKWLNSRKLLLLANAIFDIKMIFQHTNILLDGRRIFDVQVAEWALQNGREEDDEPGAKKKAVNPYKLAQAREDKSVVKKSVKHLTKKYLKLDLSKDNKVRVSNWLGEWSDAQVQYAALDVLVLFPIWHKQKSRLFIWKLSEAVQLRNTFSTVAAILDMSGIPINVPGLEAYKVELEKRLAYQDMDLRLQLQVDDDFNLNSTDQLHSKLTQHGLLLENTNEKTMKLKYANDPIVNAILDFRGTQKLLQVVNKYLTYSRDGRMYSQFRINATATGRLASGSDADKDPWYTNGQNPPKGEFRDNIEAPEGRVFINADYSQIELRWMAQNANDPVMISAYLNGEDLHTLTAIRTAKLSKEQWDKLPKEKQKNLRQKAKAQNFGLIGGAGWRRLKDYAKSDYGVDMTDEEAEQGRKEWKETYNTTAKFQHWMPKKVEEDGFIRVASGFIRWFPLPNYTETLNTSYQAPAAAGFINGMNILFYTLIEDGFVPLKDFWLPTKVHDEILFETKEEYKEEMLFRVQDSMIKGMGKYLTLVPVEVEANIIKRWSEKA